MLRIKRLQLENYLCFKSVDIEFPVDDKPILVLGNNEDSEGMTSNEAGKTSLVTAPLWAIFGLPINSDMAVDDVILKGQSNCRVVLELVNNDTVITIDRKRTKTTTELEFYVNDNLLHEKRQPAKNVQQLIHKYFRLMGTPAQALKDCLITNFLSYNSVEMFVGSQWKSSDRFNFISRLFNLDKWIECKELANQRAKDIKEQIEALENKLSGYASAMEQIDITSLKQSIEEDTASLKTLKVQIEKIEKDLNIRKKIEELESQEIQLTKVYQEKKQQLVNHLNKAKQHLCETEEQLKQLQTEYTDENKINTLKDLLENTRVKYIEASKKTNTLQATLDSYTEQLKPIVVKLTKLKKDIPEEILEKIADVDIDEHIAKQKTVIQELKEEYTELQSILVELQSKIKTIENQINEIKATEKKKLTCPNCNESLLYKAGTLVKYDKQTAEELLQEYSKEIEKYHSEKEKIAKNLSDLEEKIALISKEIEYSNQYKQVIELESQKKELETKIQKLDKELKEKLDILIDITHELKKFEKQYSEAEQVYRKYIELTTAKDGIEQNIQVVQAEQDKLDKLYQEQKAKLEEQKKQLPEDYPSETVVELNEKYNQLNEQIARLETRIKHNKELLEKNKAIIQEMADIKANISKLQKELTKYKYWVKAFPEIRRMVIQSILPQLETLSNEYLKKLNVPLSIVLDTLKKTKTTKTLKEEFNILIYDRIQDKIMPVYMRSTGGRKRIGMAVCFALQDLKQQTTSNPFGFRIFDEFPDNLDSAGLDYFFKLLHIIEGQKFVVSHNELLKDRFERVLIVTKNNGVSHVTWQR